MNKKYAVVIHGGAGEIDKSFGIEKYEKFLMEIISKGEKMLKDGESALDVVVELATLLEDCDLFNAGKGSVLNNKGIVECDASIMDGKTLNCGGVSGIKNYKNPIKVAEMVMNKSDHVILMGHGVDEFIEQEKLKVEKRDQAYFVTEHRQEQLEKAKEAGITVLDHSTYNQKYGTIGVVVRDMSGNLAAGTSTGGITNKKYGRVGDSPIIGAGTYAYNKSCAVSCTGYGEHFLKTTLAKRLSDYMEIGNQDIHLAAKNSIDYLKETVDGLGGLIAVDHEGVIATNFNTKGMFHAYASHEYVKTVSIFEKKLT